MSPPRKFILPQSLILVTFRTEEGLPFVPLPFMNEIIWSAIAKAQYLYPVTICGFNFEANHAHFLLYVTNPELIPLFVGYVKQETSHALNRLLGRRQHTVWAEDYDSPAILDFDQVLRRFAYVLLNPVKDNLVSSMDSYPGVSSWELFSSRRTTRSCLCIKRDSVPTLHNPHRPWREADSVLETFKEKNQTERHVILSPYAWKHLFPETAGLSDDEVHSLLLKAIQEQEQHYLKANKEAGSSPPPLSSLTHVSLLKPYTPSTYGKRMVCLSSSVPLRKAFIQLYRSLCAAAREALERWRAGDWLHPFPPGMFPPALPRRANLLPAAIW